MVSTFFLFAVDVVKDAPRSGRNCYVMHCTLVCAFYCKHM